MSWLDVEVNNVHSHSAACDWMGMFTLILVFHIWAVLCSEPPFPSLWNSSICLTNKNAHSCIISASTGISFSLIESICGNDVTLCYPGFTLFYKAFGLIWRRGPLHNDPNLIWPLSKAPGITGSYQTLYTGSSIGSRSAFFFYNWFCTHDFDFHPQWLHP